MIKRILVGLFSLFSAQAFSQTDVEWHETAIKRYQTNKKGMIILGSWAAVNLIGGSIVSSQTTGYDHYFYQMNAGWNLINLGIAMPTLLRRYKTPSSFAENVKQQHFMEKILLLNIGLDVAYLVGGAYLNQLSINNANPEMLHAYGNSIALQGGFLFLFDCGLYYFTHQNGKQINKYLEKISLSSNGIGVKLEF